MKKWWTTKAWPWLKENWWVILALPLALIVVIAMIVHNVMRGRVFTVDPVREADQRAADERVRREREMQAEIDLLEEEKAEISARYEALQAEFDERLKGEVQDLRKDPERLRRLMLGINE